MATLLIASAAVAWSAPADAAPPIIRTPYFTDVACPTTSNCLAVGNVVSSSGTTTTMAEHWNGKQWSITPTPSLPNTSHYGGTFLNDVACSTPTSCFAVGYSGALAQQRIKTRPFVVHWNGKKWAIVPSANPPGNAYSELESVSCVAGNKCLAVGHAQPAVAAGQGLFERWNGKAFTIVPSERIPAGAIGTALFGVKCRSAANCYAVGHTNGGAIIEHWDGTSWTVAAKTDRAPELFSVSCPTATRCVAVGNSYDTRGNEKALIAVWDGTSWSQPTSDDPPGDRTSRLHDVSCPNAATCVAVGSLGDTGHSSSTTLVEQSAGNTWSRVPSPNSAAQSNPANSLTGVACPTVKNCFAVGAAPGARAEASIMHWNGKSWKLAAHPIPK